MPKPVKRPPRRPLIISPYVLALMNLAGVCVIGNKNHVVQVVKSRKR